MKSRPSDTLKDAVRSGAFTPGVRDVDGLIDLLATDDDDQVKAVQKAILRVGRPVAAAVLARLPESKRPVRGHLVKILGRMGQVTLDPGIAGELLTLLDDPDLKTRRNAIIALGHLPLPGIEQALLQKWAREDRVDHRRSIAASLGRIGGPKSLDALRVFNTDDAELRRIINQATLMIARSRSRGGESSIDADALPPEPVKVIAHCRSGLEAILAEEFDARLNPKTLGTGRVGLTLRGTLASLYEARIFLNFGIALPPVGGAGPQAVVTALTGDAAMRVFRTWTRGMIRYRIEWAVAGHKRSAVWNCAKDIAALRPEMVNDPTNSTWEALVHQSKRETRIELQPKKLPDPRFAYRVSFVYASSHPTLAAALARVSKAQPDDVVWDPFVGSGTELVERAKLGPWREMRGSDSDPKAVAAAEKNLKEAGIKADLRVGDALTDRMPGVTLIVTNPPMGRRSRRGDVGPLLARFLENAARCLGRGGRLVWISPMPDRHADEARKAGLALTFRQTVDMGGFEGQIQRYEKR